MTRRKLGYLLAAAGLLLIAAGLYGLTFNQLTVAPSADLLPKTSYFTGTYENPEITSYMSENTNSPAPGVPAFHKVTRIASYSTDNPNSGAPSDALLLSLAAVPDKEFSIIVLVEADKPPAPGPSKELYGMQWQLTYSNGKFLKSAQQVRADGITVKPSDHFNTRYQGFVDRAEVEFYGPPGTRYHAILLNSGEYCSFIQPKA